MLPKLYYEKEVNFYNLIQNTVANFQGHSAPSSF